MEAEETQYNKTTLEYQMQKFTDDNNDCKDVISILEKTNVEINEVIDTYKKK